MHPWKALFEQLLLTLEQPQAAIDFERMKEGSEVLRIFGRAENLVRFLNEHRAEHPDEKNQILGYLLGWAVQENALNGTARNILFIAMFPALDRVFKSLRRFVEETRDPEGKLTNDIYWAFHVEIDSWDFAARHRVAATLQLNVKRKIKKQYILACAPREKPIHPVDEKKAAADTPLNSILPDLSALRTIDEAKIIAALQSATRLKDRDLRLILGRFLHDKSFSDLASELGVSEANARQRFHRALDRLREQKSRQV